MKFLGLITFLTILIQQSYLELRADALSSGGFVRTKGVQFSLNGYPYYANGFNAYWLIYVASDPSQRPKISAAFQEASRHGMTVARTWAFSDGGYGPLQYSPGSYNEDMFQGLDFAVAEARRNGIKIILSYANNYVSFGGKKQYVDWARSQGRPISSEDDFFTDSLVKDFYKNHIKAVLNRFNTFTKVHYKDDPTIMAWDNFQDGYGIILSQSSSTVNVIAQQSRKLTLIRKIFARMINVDKWKRARGQGQN